MLAPVFRPFDRPARTARRKRNEEVLGVEFAARAEPAADIVLDELDGALGQAHLSRQRPAVEEQHLGGAVDRELSARGIPLREQSARLHGKRHVALRAKALAPDIRGTLERGRGVPAHRAELHREIAAALLEQQRCIARGGLAVSDRGKRLDFNLDQSQCILSNRGARREDHGERLAHIADLGLRNDGLTEGFELRQGLEPHREARHAFVRLDGTDLIGGDD